MASEQQMVWPGSWPVSGASFYGPSPYGQAVYRVPYSVCEYVGAPSVVSHCSNIIPANTNAKDNKRFLLDRSVFDLVDAHLYLSLTDPKLLGWYLRLSQEDRKLIQYEGGLHQFLQSHPALELSGHHVFVKYNMQGTSPAKSAMTAQKKTEAKKYMWGLQLTLTTLSTEEELKKLPSPVRETLSLLNCCSDRAKPPSSQKHPHEQVVQLQDSYQTAFSYHSAQDSNQPKAQKGLSLLELKKEEASWQMTPSSSSALCENPATPASFTVDMEPERCRQEEKPELWSQTEMTQGWSAYLSHPEASAFQSDWSSIEQDSSKYYSFNSVQTDSLPFTDSTVSKLEKPERLSSQAAGLDHFVYGEEGAGDDEEASLSCGDSNNSYSIMRDDQSILAAIVPREERRREESAETVTSTPSPVTKRDVMVGTEPTQRTSASTNTEAPGSSDKHVITEVHMADLDYLTEEFIKLKLAKEELKKLKEKMKSPGCKWGKECECLQRAQQAELGLLALQYHMCRQHCWRLFSTCADREQLTQGPKDPPAHISSVVQKLESDFIQMRAEILAGVPLKQLKPLFVDCGRIMTGESYVPAQIIAGVLGNVAQTQQTSSQEKGCVVGQNSASSQRKERDIKKESSKVKRAVTLLPQDKITIPNAKKKPEERQTAVCKELNSSEAWFDAEEELKPETGGDATKDEPSAPESCSEDVKLSFLFVSNLPSHVTESDVMRWFENYNPSEVSIFEKDMRVAIVTIRGSQSAEAAVRELNGCNMQGHTVHVQVLGPSGGGQNQDSDSTSSPEAAQTNVKPSEPGPEKKLVPQPPPGSSVRNGKVVCSSLAAGETCVPQHYCSMGGFDRLLSELRQRHPEVSRQRIVDALVSLRAKHHGVLSGLPLRTIRDMTSELLTSQHSDVEALL